MGVAPGAIATDFGGGRVRGVRATTIEKELDITGAARQMLVLGLALMAIQLAGISRGSSIISSGRGGSR